MSEEFFEIQPLIIDDLHFTPLVDFEEKSADVSDDQIKKFIEKIKEIPSKTMDTFSKQKRQLDEIAKYLNHHKT